ncbi:MAG: GNAT family N-acetyltransferase [Acidobacteria bacterium]|nr:GNAT family N-acetyltransferase [Acidobacteriota bacterium]
MEFTQSEIGYWIDKAEEGQGIITRSTALLIEYAFEELKLNRIEIRCWPRTLEVPRSQSGLDFYGKAGCANPSIATAGFTTSMCTVSSRTTNVFGRMRG